MPWIKKNLMLVLGGLVGLVLLFGSGFILFSEADRDTQVTTQLEEKRAEWDRLNNLNPFPDEKNIRALKEETTRVRKVTDDLRGSIKPVDVPPVNDTFALRLLIERTISDLTKEAEEAGVDLPDKYAFTFQKLRDIGGQFDSNGIPRLAEQVEQIRTLCGVLFRAKVHSLDTLRRPAILKEEGAGSDYLTKKSVTNNWVVRTPYDLTFKAFSSELASVIRGFAALDQLVVIKTINIDPTTLRSSPGSGMPFMTVMPGASPMMPPPGVGGPGGMDPALAARYGLGGGRRPGEGGAGPGGMDPALASRYGLGGGADAMRSRYGGLGGGPAAPPPPTLSSPGPSMAPGVPGAPAGPSTVLDEKPLRVIIQLDFVKPKPATEPARRTTSRPAPTGDGAAAAAEPEPDASAAPPAE